MNKRHRMDPSRLVTLPSCCSATCAQLLTSPILRAAHTHKTSTTQQNKTTPKNRYMLTLCWNSAQHSFVFVCFVCICLDSYACCSSVAALLQLLHALSTRLCVYAQALMHVYKTVHTDNTYTFLSQNLSSAQLQD